MGVRSSRIKWKGNGTAWKWIAVTFIGRWRFHLPSYLNFPTKHLYLYNAHCTHSEIKHKNTPPKIDLAVHRTIVSKFMIYKKATSLEIAFNIQQERIANGGFAWWEYKVTRADQEIRKYFKKILAVSEAVQI